MNHPFKIKICGVTTADDAKMVAESSADAIGLNFYPSSKRYVDLPASKLILSALEQQNATLVTVGVFVNASVDHILNVAGELQLDTIQLHGDETPDFLRQLVQETDNRTLAFDFVRAVRTLPSSSQPAMDLAEIESEIKLWADAGADAILIDAAVAGDFGGTGKQVDWEGFAKLTSSIPKILAGGLTPENVEKAIEMANPSGVDVASGVEASPGKKDRGKTHSFCSAAASFFK